MDNEFYIRKIKQLTDEKLKELLQLRTKENHVIIEIAEKEALDRGIDLETIGARILESGQNKTKEDRRLNWILAIAEFLDGTP